MSKSLGERVGEFILTPVGIAILIIGIVVYWLYSKNEKVVNEWLKIRIYRTKAFFVSMLYLGLTLLLLGGIIWIVVKTVGAIGNIGKYEGQTAREWFNDNDVCEAQLDDYQQCVESVIPNIVNYCSP